MVPARGMDRTVFKNVRLTIRHNQPSTVASTESRVPKLLLALAAKSIAFLISMFAIFIITTVLAPAIVAFARWSIMKIQKIRMYNSRIIKYQINFFIRRDYYATCRLINLYISSFTALYTFNNWFYRYRIYFLLRNTCCNILVLYC